MMKMIRTMMKLGGHTILIFEMESVFGAYILLGFDSMSFLKWANTLKNDACIFKIKVIRSKLSKM